MPFHCNAILVHVNVLSLILVGTLYSHDHCRHGRQWCRGFWRVLVRYGYVLHVHEGRDYALLLRVLRCRSVRLYKPLWFSIKHLAMRTLHFSLPLSFLFWHFIFLKLASQIIVMMIIRASKDFCCRLSGFPHLMCISITFLVILPFLYFLPYLLHHLLTSLIPSFLLDRQHRWERVRGAHQVSERSVSNSFDWLAMLYYDWSSSTSHSFNLQIPLLSLINNPLLFHSFSLPSPLTHSASPLLSLLLLCRTINNAAPSFPKNFLNALQSFDVNKDGLIDFSEFLEMERRFPMIMFPAFRLQDRLQRGSLGTVVRHRLYDAPPTMILLYASK